MASSFTVMTHAAVPAEELFDVSLSIDQHVASMSASGERAVAGVTNGHIGLGETVTWRARHFGIWFAMTSEITALDRPNRFVDEQIRGPFRSFHHDHSFMSDGGMTLMVDTITIRSPIFGRLAERVVLIPYLRRLIRERNRHLLTVLDAQPGTDPQSPTWPDAGSTLFRRSEVSALIGRGEEVWARASHDLLRWAVKTRSGFRVDGLQPVEPGAELTITARWGGVTVREPVRVASVVETASRVGISYRTRPGHPVSGEEAFIVHRTGEEVYLTIRSLTAPASRQPWRTAYPLLRLAQVIARRRYLRALG